MREGRSSFASPLNQAKIKQPFLSPFLQGYSVGDIFKRHKNKLFQRRMKSVVAVGITIGIILLPIILTILFGISIFNAIKPTSIASIPIFIIILLIHILIIIISYKKFNRSQDFTCRLSAPYYDFFLLCLQIIFCVFGIVLAIVNMQNSNGKCAFVSSSSFNNDGEGSDDGEDGDIASTTPSFRESTDDDMSDGSASCGGVTIVFLLTAIILCLKLFTLPILRNLTALTKQVRYVLVWLAFN